MTRPISRPGERPRAAYCFAFAGRTACCVVSGCSRAPQHADWVIHSAIEVIGAPPAGGYRLIFPYIVGDFYGPANTGGFVVPGGPTATGFTLDLNRTQAGA